MVSSVRRLQAILLAAGVGAVLILLGLFGTAASVVGLVLIVIGTVLSAPAAPSGGEAGRGWWHMLAAGAGVSLVAALVALAAKTLGGLLAVVGGTLVMIGVTLGFPLARERR